MEIKTIREIENMKRCTGKAHNTSAVRKEYNGEYIIYMENQDEPIFCKNAYQVATKLDIHIDNEEKYFLMKEANKVIITFARKEDCLNKDNNVKKFLKNGIFLGYKYKNKDISYQPKIKTEKKEFLKIIDEKILKKIISITIYEKIYYPYKDSIEIIKEALRSNEI